MSCHICNNWTPEKGCEHYHPNMKQNAFDCFIVSFNDNSQGILDIFEGKTIVRGVLSELTKGKARYVDRDSKGRIEIAIPFGIFLDIKDNRQFQELFVNVSRLRTSARNILGAIVFSGISSFDNELPKDWNSSKITMPETH